MTLLVNEIDNFLPGGKAETDSKTILGILNGGYRQGLGAARHRWPSPRVVQPVGPKALTGIGELPRTLASRSLRFRMRRRRRDEPVERFRPQARGSRGGAVLPLRFASSATEDVIAALEGADADCRTSWRTGAGHCRAATSRSLTSQEATGPRARKAFVRVFADAHDAAAAESQGTRLLADLRDLFAANGDRIATATLLEHLNALEERPWVGWNDSGGLKPRNLSGLLRPYSSHSGTVRSAGRTAKTAKGYKLEAFEDAFARYLPSESVTSVATAPLSENEGDPDPSQRPGM